MATLETSSEANSDRQAGRRKDKATYRATALPKKFYVIVIIITCLEYEKIQRTTLYDFISGWGGFFGLLVGFSIISFLEIIYWLIFKILLGR